VVEHIVVRKNIVERFLSGWVKGRRTTQRVASEEQETLYHLPALFAYLSSGQFDQARGIVATVAAQDIAKLHPSWGFGGLLVDSQQSELLEIWLSSCARSTDEDFRRNEGWLRGRSLLERLKLNEAAKLFRDLTPQARKHVSKDFVLCELLLASLGLMPHLSPRAMKQICEQDLVGTSRDLGRMFLRLKMPKPSKLWPHPLWHPEWRLWLAIWLELRGKRKEARHVAEPSLDVRYGMTHSQPALRALMQRTS
jgi:hypothetical protein